MARFPCKMVTCLSAYCHKTNLTKAFNSLITEPKLAEFANSIDLDEVAHDEPPHLDQHSLLSSL